MALFNRRNKDTNVLPAEAQEYYATERRERTGVAWLLALTTLVVTFLIAAALFFGGRWLYQTIIDNDEKKDAPSTSQEEGLRVDDKGNVIGGNQESTSQDTGVSSTSTTSSTTTPSTTTPTTQPTITPSTGPSELVDTGPGDE